MKRFALLFLSAAFTFVTGVALAQVKITDLPAASTLTGAEPVPIVQGGATVQTTATAIAALGGGGLTLAVGTYSPTCTPSPSIMTACTPPANASQYIRVGSKVMFVLWFNATSSANQLGQGNISIPIASNFGAVTEATGVCTGYTNTTPSAGRIEADTTENNLRLFLNSSVAAGGPWSCTGMYAII